MGPGHRPVSLISAHICEARTYLLPPNNRFALVAAVTEIMRFRHFRNMLFHQIGIATIPVAGKDKHVASDHLQFVHVSAHPDARDASLSIAVKNLCPMPPCNGKITLLSRIQQRSLQCSTGFLRHRVHPVGCMPRIKKAVDQNKR